LWVLKIDWARTQGDTFVTKDRRGPRERMWNKSAYVRVVAPREQ